MSDEDAIPNPIDAGIAAAMATCVAHATDLFESAKVVRASGRANIAYHLAALALEELGRRELLGVETIAGASSNPPAWPMKATQDHVKKLFWCFFGGNFLAERITKETFEDMIGLARRIHDTRLAGLYVDVTDDAYSIPSTAVGNEEIDNLLRFTEVRLAHATGQSLRKTVTLAEVEQQAWFLKVADDPETRKYIFSKESLDKLAELKDAKAWAQWLRELFNKADAAAMTARDAELLRSKALPPTRTKDKWRIRTRIKCASHSIRPKALNEWNKQCDWVKLTASKTGLIVEFILGDDIPVEALWVTGFGLYRVFVAALNLGTLGFWWWRLPEQTSRFYEDIVDLESKHPFGLDRNPELKINWGENRVLAEQDLVAVAAVLNALPRPNEQTDFPGVAYYLGGLNFLSLNDVHWQCEIQALGNFIFALKAWMEQTDECTVGDDFAAAFRVFFDEAWGQTDDRDRAVEIVAKFESDQRHTLTADLKDVALIKCFAEHYFLRKVLPMVLRARHAEMAMA